jgi:hypothetical protein
MSQQPKRPLTSAQIRAARALIRWSAEDLARHSSVSLRTLRRAELAERETKMTAANDLSVRRALEAAGVEFTNGDQPGVRPHKGTAAFQEGVMSQERSSVVPGSAHSKRARSIERKK